MTDDLKPEETVDLFADDELSDEALDRAVGRAPKATFTAPGASDAPGVST